MDDRLAIQAFYDGTTGTVSYVLFDRIARRGAVIDPVLDFDYKSARTTTQSADEIVRFVEDEGITIDWILETHAHADHLSAACHLQHRLGGRIAIGERIHEVQ